MSFITSLVLVTMSCVVLSKPLENAENTDIETAPITHSIQKRFINSALTSGDFNVNGLHKIRTKRSEEEEDCEKLELCRLHARSQHSIFAAFQLYFVNRENARLWDHRVHHDCNQRFKCYDE